jgi:signal transduction histidine kinase
VRSSEFPYLADWIVITLRWIALLGLTVASVFFNLFNWQLILPLALILIWNILNSLLAMTNRRMPNHRIFNVLVDGIGSLGIFLVSGGAMGSLIWAGLLPLLSAAVYYEWLGTLITGLMITAIQSIGLFFSNGMQITWWPIAGIALFNLITAGTFGLLSIRLMSAMRRNYKKQLSHRGEVEVRAKRSERERLRALYDMIEALSATLNYQDVLESALDLCIENLEGNPPSGEVVCAFLLFHDDLLQVEVARRFPSPDMKATFPVESGVLNDALHKGEMQLIQNPSQDPELHCLLVLQACQAALCLPLLRGMNAFGFMLLAHPNPNYFTPDRQELLEMISHQSVIAIQNARMFLDLEKENEHIVSTQEETRRKLARDLHDGPTQSVAAIAMRLSVARRLIDQDVPETKLELEKIEDLARRTTKEIRHMLFLLRPLALENEGLQAAMEAMATKMRETYQQDVQAQIDPTIVSLIEQGKQTVIFYIAEEAVNNARKHAQAEHIWVRLKSIPKESSIVLLEIVDDGVGFDLDSVTKSYDKRGSLGMINLRERTDLVNGLLNVKSAPGQGTRVRVYIPLTQEAADRLHAGNPGR